MNNLRIFVFTNLLIIFSMSSEGFAQVLDGHFIFDSDDNNSKNKEESGDYAFAWQMLAGFAETAAALFVLEKGPGFVSKFLPDDVVPFGAMLSILGAALAAGSGLVYELEHTEIWNTVIYGALGALESMTAFAVLAICASHWSKSNRIILDPDSYFVPYRAQAPGTIVLVPQP